LNEHAVLPFRATEGAAGYDLVSAEDTVVPAHGKALVSTGLIIAVPAEHYGRIAPRSSLAWKNFIDTGAGVVDSDYRGEVKVILYNHAAHDFTVKRGDKIAQLIIEKVSLPRVVEVGEISDTARGAGGFGSTGVRI
jgi:deoxyuridine 5'-triphosphate nucleotidohydrolase